MVGFFLRRVFAVIPTLVLASVVVFLLMHIMPGDPAGLLLGPDATPAEIEALKESMGLNAPLPSQFVQWFSGLLHGDLGISVYYAKPVAEIFLQHASTSAVLGSLALAVACAIGLPVGIFSALKSDTWVDHTARIAALSAATTPSFVLGLVLMYLFSIRLGWLPSVGISVAEGGMLPFRSFILPSITLGAPNAAILARLTRSCMMDVMREEYITAARAKGLSEKAVILKHALRASAVPIFTLSSVILGGLVSAAVVTETVFAIPGVGRLISESVLKRDYPVIEGVLLVVAVLYLMINLLTDILNVFLDPRIRYD